MSCITLTCSTFLSHQLFSYNNSSLGKVSHVFSKSMNTQCSFFLFFSVFFTSILTENKNHIVTLKFLLPLCLFYNSFPYLDRAAYQLCLSIIAAILHFLLIFENWYQCTLCSLFWHLILSNIALTIVVNRFTDNYPKRFHA